MIQVAIVLTIYVCVQDKVQYFYLDGSRECKCGLNKIVCNSKHKQKYYKYWCECKELDEWSSCKDEYLLSPSLCDCECNKACKLH